MVQYRDRLMPLIRLSAPAAGQASLHVIVHAGDHGPVGLVVDEILDIVEQPQAPAPEPGGSESVAVLGRQVTELIDLPALLARTVPA